METYNYRENVKEDIKEYIENNYEKEDFKDKDKEEMYETLYDEMWTADSVTGNGSGSYTFNAYKAEEYLCHNFDLAQEAFENFGYNGVDFSKGVEGVDVTIRCYLLSELLEEVLEEIYEE